MGEARVVLSFARDDKYCRHSEGDFIRLNDGTIMIVYTRFKGTSAGDAAPADLVKRFSYDNGETWTEPEEVYCAREFKAQNVMSVSLTRMDNGDIGLLFIIKQVQGYINRLMFARSADEGKSFYTVSECGPKQFAARMGTNNARIVRLSSGRIILPLAIHAGVPKTDGIVPVDDKTAGYFEYSEEKGYSWVKPERLKDKRTSKYTIGTFMYSDDDGFTWNKAEDTVCPSFTGSDKGIQEGCVFEIRPGVLKCFWRTDKMYQYEALSFDNGIHWTHCQPSCFTSNCSPITVTRNPYNGKIYAIWNPIPIYNDRETTFVGSGRTPLAIAEMNEDLTEFGEIRHIEDDPAFAYAYTAPMFTSENELLLAYCAGGPEDRHGLSRLTIAKMII